MTKENYGLGLTFIIYMGVKLQNEVTEMVKVLPRQLYGLGYINHYVEV